MDNLPNPDEVYRQLELVLLSDGFVGAPKLQRFLRHVVDRALQGREEEIKESVIGVEVYQKPVGYDPRLDATVRVEASKLRQRLDHYYEGDGAHASIRISIHKGGYVPSIERRMDQPQAMPLPAQPASTLPGPLAPAAAWHSARWLRTGVSLLVLAIPALVGWILLSSRSSQESTTVFTRLNLLSDVSSFAVEPILSPDASFVVYASDRNSPGVLNLWRQQIEGGLATQLTQLQSAGRTPTISSDGERVAFRLEEDGGLLGIVPAGGGAIRRISSARRARNPRFSPTQNSLAFWVPQDEQTLDRGSVFLQDPDTPNADPARLFAEFAHASHPVWSGDGQRILAIGTWQSGVPAQEYDAWTLEIGEGQARGAPRKTGLFPLLLSLGMYRGAGERAKVLVGDWRDGWLYFSAPSGDAENIYRIQLQPGLTVSGKPQAVTAGAGRNLDVRVALHRMVFANLLVSYNLFSAPLPGGSSTVRQLTRERGTNMRASIDRAGRRAGWEKRISGSAGSQLWTQDFASHQGRQLGGDLTSNLAFVLLSPDGLRVVYQALEGTKQAIYLENFAAGPPRRVCVDCGAPSDWSESGSHLLFINGRRPSGVGLLEVASGRITDLLNHPSYGLYGARYRVDAGGNGWMSLYADTGPRTRQIFAAPVTNYRPAGYQHWIPITDGANWDLSPAWGPGGRSIFFVSHRDGDRCIWNQPLDPATHRPAGDPQPVHHFHSPARTLMQSLNYRGADALWVADGKLFFALDQTSSSLWLKE